MVESNNEHPLTLWTIGHSTRTTEELVAALDGHHIRMLADVRRYPGSRRFPHFRAGALKASLAQADIEYLALPELGGRRDVRPDSRNTAWRETAFRGYADHMETATFLQGIDRLVQAASRQATAVMCAERSWLHCHRALIADYLKAAGVRVIHITDAAQSTPHEYTHAAHLIDGKLSYQGPQATLKGLD